MITELYALDQELTERSMGNDLTFEIMEKSGSTWQTTMTLLPSQIVAESFELDQSICDSDELVIGGCIPSQLKLSVMNTADLTGKRIVVKIRGRYRSEPLYPGAALYPSDSLFPGYSVEQTAQYALFAGKIISCKRSENKRYRKLVAFDRMYHASTLLCKKATYDYINDNYWDTPPQAQKPTMYLWNLIHYLCNKGKITRQSGTNNDFINWYEPFDIHPDYFNEAVDDKFTPLQGLKWICELNGAFWIEDMPESLDADNATPRNILLYNDRSTRYSISTYSKLTYEDFSVKEIRKATFFAHKGSATIELQNNQGYSFYASDNGLAKSMQDAKSDSETSQPERSIYNAVNNLSSRILSSVYEYRPFKASIFNRWWVQVGDRVRFTVNDGDLVYVQSIVLSRKIKGINALKVTVEAKGLEVQGKEIDTSSA